jgi:hypothetical protein
MQLEHATLPPYLTALYSLKAGTNSDAYHVLRVTAVEEMLHLTLAANVLNAVGGSPDLTKAGFVPEYPAYLPDGETDFTVSRQSFTPQALDTFLSIERPRQAPDESKRLVKRTQVRRNRLAVPPGQPDMQYYSIGEFYEEIARGVHHLHKRLGDGMFSGSRDKQVTPEYFYSGGGEVIPVTDLESATRALDLVAEQGEGFGGGIYDDEAELAHYYRFEQLKLGRYYQPGDQPHQPTGPELRVDWAAVYQVKPDATLGDYPQGSELYAAAADFNRCYGEFLSFLTRAYNGEPALLQEAVVEMFRLRNLMTRLIHNPVPGSSVNAAPTFEVSAQPAVVAS